MRNNLISHLLFRIVGRIFSAAFSDFRPGSIGREQALVAPRLTSQQTARAETVLVRAQKFAAPGLDQHLTAGEQHERIVLVVRHEAQLLRFEASRPGVLEEVPVRRRLWEEVAHLRRVDQWRKRLGTRDATSIRTGTSVGRLEILAGTAAAQDLQLIGIFLYRRVVDLDREITPRDRGQQHREQLQRQHCRLPRRTELHSRHSRHCLNDVFTGNFTSRKTTQNYNTALICCLFSMSQHSKICKQKRLREEKIPYNTILVFFEDVRIHDSLLWSQARHWHALGCNFEISTRFCRLFSLSLSLPLSLFHRMACVLVCARNSRASAAHA